MTRTTLIVVPATASTHQAMADQADRAVARGAEAVELRMDALKDLTGQVVKDLVARVRSMVGPGRPVIVTCRDSREGGLVDHPIAVRMEALASATEAGAEFVDVELENFGLPEAAALRAALARSPRTRLILSSHAWEAGFASLSDRYRASLAAQDGAIPKLVYTARHVNDCFDALDLLHSDRREKIVFCMGAAGLVTRVLAKKLAGLFTYASVDAAGATAPGQIPIDQMKGLYRSDAIDGDTEFYGVIGDPVAHSMSPAIHNACLAGLGINAVYLPFWVAGGRDGLCAFLDAVRRRPWLGLRGFSVTVPHKQGALEYVQARGGSVQGLAGRIGAANTLLLDAAGGLEAFNTDYLGAMDALLTTLNLGCDQLKGWPVAVIGAGGVARAIVAGLRDAQAEVTIYNRTAAKAQVLAAEFGCRCEGLDGLEGRRCELLVNCTSVGMHPNVDAMPVPASVLRPDMAVFDTVYNPVQTQLLRTAAEKGAVCVDGVSMFVSQAMAQFRLFTGKDADRTLMAEVVARALGSD
jgi:3-dehydroquinate dehydratase/shikimate dehydrogenase